MANVGRKPKPIGIKVLEGNPGRRDISSQIDLENRIDKIDVENIEAPEWIKNNKIANDEWNRVVPILTKAKMITQADTIALEAYCKCWSRYKEAEQQMDQVNTTYFKTGSGYIQQLPQIAIAQKYLKLCKDFMTEFGLTPSSRGRMQLPGTPDDNDEMENLLNGE